MNNYVQTINARNFKGRTFTHPLRPVVVLHGDNSAGKTAVTDAIRILLLGYSPRHGKQGQKTFGFAGSPTGAVEMIVGGIVGGKTVERSWTMKKGSVKAGGFEGEIVPSVMMDANEWLKLGGPAKTRFIFNQLDLAALGFSTEKVTARLKADLKVEKPDEASERLIGEVIDSVVELAEFRDHEKQTYQEWIEATVEHFKNQQAAAKAVVDDMEGAIGATTTLRAQEGLQAGQSVAGELATARKALQDALTAFQTLDRQDSDYRSKADRKRKTEAALQGLKDESTDIAKMQTEFDGQIARLREYKSETNQLFARQASAASDIMSARRAVEAANGEVARMRAELEADLQRQCCPYCKSKGKGWKDALKTSVEELIADKEKQAAALADAVKVEQTKFDQLTAPLEASRTRDGEVDKLRSANFDLGSKITAAKTRQQTLTVLRARAEELANIGQPADQQALTTAMNAVEKARGEVERLEAIERQQIAQMQDQRRQEQARQAHETKKIEVEIYKLAVKSMLALQGDMMKAAFGGFMKTMNVLAADIFPGGDLVFHDGQIGYFAGASFVAMEYFGGTEEMLAFAGLSLTLAQSSPMKIIIMDELGRVKRHRRINLIRRMIQLVRDGVIDQFIGIDVDGDPYDSFGVAEEFTLIEIK